LGIRTGHLAAANNRKQNYGDFVEGRNGRNNCNLAEIDPSVPSIEAQYGRMPLAELKKLAFALKSRPERKGAEPQF
jgi:hypothetical protein